VRIDTDSSLRRTEVKLSESTLPLAQEVFRSLFAFSSLYTSKYVRRCEIRIRVVRKEGGKKKISGAEAVRGALSVPA
jgi:hypothetical protein